MVRSQRIHLGLLLVHSFLVTVVYCGSSCPQKTGSDPTDVKGRLNALSSQSTYYHKVDKYLYKLTLCKSESDDDNAVTQTIGAPSTRIVILGTYEDAVARGGVDWILITYSHGEAYNKHCNGNTRKSDVLITCDPNANRGTFKLIEEYATNSTSGPKATPDATCSYLFEINNKAACTAKPPTPMSPGSILLIIVLIVGGVYVGLGLLYQRFVVGAKGMEQIPNYNMWRAFGDLQADGCNFICRCTETRRPPRYKPMEDAISDDLTMPDDDNLLPM